MERSAGIGAVGRKLEKPVAYYTLSWAEGETPDRQEQMAAVESSLKVTAGTDRSESRARVTGSK